MAAHHWLTQLYRPITARLAEAGVPEQDPAELYCQVLEHKWFLSERAQRDVGHEHALEDYVRRFAHE